MDLYLVTIKLPKNPEHNPRSKRTGECPASETVCTDITGEHHTVLAASDAGLEAVVTEAKDFYGHVTRIELVNEAVIDSVLKKRQDDIADRVADLLRETPEYGPWIADKIREMKF